MTDVAPRVSWSRDELILALDLYMRNPSAPASKVSAEVADLSSTLNRLAAVLGVPAGPDYRNANGVYMKMMNFRRVDPAFDGRKGLERGNSLEPIVWAEFAGDPARLAVVASSIRATVDASAPGELAAPVEEGLEEAEEGRLLTRLHLTRERSRKLVERRKALELASTGRLACAACDFDFKARYGARGEGFIEAHHARPVHTLAPGDRTKLSDLALLCANCHRMIHVSRPWLTVTELRSILRP